MAKKTWTKKELDSFKTKIHNKRLVLAEDLR